MVTEKAEILQDVETGGATQGNRRVRIRSAHNEVQSFLSFEHRNTGHSLQRPSSAHTPSTQPLPSLKLRRWRPVSAGGYSSQAFYDKQSGALRKDYNNAKSDSFGKTPKPPETRHEKSDESKPQKKMSVLERNYRKSRLMRFKYPIQMHSWVGPQPSEVPGVLKRSVPRCLQRGNYYGRLPQRQNCHYAPWKSITLVNRHSFTSFSLPHPRNKKEQEALKLKAMATPRTPRNAVPDSDEEEINEPTENILELTAALGDEDGEEADKNGTFHYVHEETKSNKGESEEEKYSEDEEDEDEDEEEEEEEYGKSVNSHQSDEYEYQDLPGSHRKDESSSNDEYEEEFSDAEREDAQRKEDEANKKKKVHDSNSDIEDETEYPKESHRSGSRRGSNTSNRSSKGRRDSIDDSIVDEVESKKSILEPTPRKNEETGSEDEVFDEIDDESKEKEKQIYQQRQDIHSETESVIEDEEENDKKSVTSKHSRKSEASKRSRSSKRSISSHVSSSSDSEAEVEENLKTMRQNSVQNRKDSVESQKSSARSKNQSILSRQSSVISNRRESLNSPKESVRSKQESVLSRNNSIISERKGSARSRQESFSGSKASVASVGRHSQPSPRDSARDSGRNSVASNRRDSETSPIGSARYRRGSASSGKNSHISNRSRKDSAASQKSNASDKGSVNKQAPVDSDIEEDETKGEDSVTLVREGMPDRYENEDETTADAPEIGALRSHSGERSQRYEYEHEKKKVSWKSSSLHSSRPTISDIGTDSEEDLGRATMFY